MKTLEFETSKGKFTLVDGFDPINGGVNLSEITEDQANEIMVSISFLGFKVYDNFLDSNNVCYTAVESLHSLLKSKGVHLFENPIKERFVYFGGKKVETFEYQEAERKTFYNPYIFKIQ